jgi:hypothetical protein
MKLSSLRRSSDGVTRRLDDDADISTSHFIFPGKIQ